MKRAFNGKKSSNLLYFKGTNRAGDFYIHFNTKGMRISAVKDALSNYATFTSLPVTTVKLNYQDGSQSDDGTDIYVTSAELNQDINKTVPFGLIRDDERDNSKNFFSWSDKSQKEQAEREELAAIDEEFGSGSAKRTSQATTQPSKRKKVLPFEDVSCIQPDPTATQEEPADTHTPASDMRDEIVKLTEEVTTLTSNVAGLNDIITDVKAGVAGIGENVTGVQASVAGIDDKMGGVQASVASISDNVTGVQVSVASIDDKMTDLGDNVNGVQEHVAEIRDGVVEFVHSMTEIKDEVTVTLGAEITYVRDQNCGQRFIISRLNHKCDLLQNRLDESMHKNLALSEKNTAILEDNIRKEKNIKRLLTRVNFLGNKCARTIRELHVLKLEMAAVKAHLNI